MKKFFVLAAVAMMAAMSVQAQEEEVVNAYFTQDDMPDMMVFLPGPPDSTSVAFMNDVARYYWGKEMRNDPERAAEATRDAVYGLETILTEFEEAFGMKISKEDTPEIYKVLLEGTATCDSICTRPKHEYMRRRPFMVFNEPTLYPEDEPALRKNGSYPSGHTLLGWSSALLMMEINPDRATEILTRGYRYGENRLVVGAHWQSDTDAARLAASAAYARLHTSERFLEQMKKAREEYQRLKGESTPVQQSSIAPMTTIDSSAYTLQGTPATATTRGIIIQKQRKMVRK
ncbi:MAG: phosphatase PAP2 family protein [Prevotella sp.]|nr:phosphatase PAP2 family protein [Prevotella sp.]